MKRSCIDDETIADYLEGRLTPSGRDRVEKHLCECADCRELLLMGAEMLDGDAIDAAVPVSAAVTQHTIDALQGTSTPSNRLKRKIIQHGRQLFERGRSWFNGDAPGWRPEPVAVRGAGDTPTDGQRLTKLAFSGIEVTVGIEPMDETGMMVEVQLISATPLSPPLRVELFIDSREVGSETLVDEAVQFESIPVGTYTLRFYQAGQAIKAYTFEV